MSAIGDYIHLNAQNYIEHGTTKYGKFQAYKSRADIIKGKAKQNASSSLSPKEQEDLASVLESMLKSNSNNPYIQKAQQEVEKKMKELFKDALGEIDWDTGDILFDMDTNTKVGKASSSIDINDMLKRIDKLDNVLIGMIDEGRVGASEVKINLSKLKKEYLQSIEKIKKEKKAKGLPFTLTSRDAATSLGAYKNQLNELIKEWAAYPSVYLQKGTFFEHLITYAPMVAKNSAEVELGKVIGDSTENVGLNKDKFASKFITKDFGENFLETTRVSQGKIDVEMKWEGKDIKISAKNVNLGNRYVQLLTGSSLLYLLQDENAIFVNHALNILSTHPRGPGVSQIAAMRTDMINELRLIILYKALTGDVNGRNTANLFVANDNKTGKVKVHDVNDIITKVSENLSSSVAIKGLAASNFKQFKNTFASTPDIRISALLADVHSRKISVGLKTNLLS